MRTRKNGVGRVNSSKRLKTDAFSPRPFPPREENNNEIGTAVKARLAKQAEPPDRPLSRGELLEQITAAAKQCQKVEHEFGNNPAPELETLIKVYRVILLQISAGTDCNPETVRLVSSLMKPVVDWARLQEQRKERKLAEKKYRDQKAALERELKAAKTPGGLKPATMEEIEAKLRLV